MKNKLRSDLVRRQRFQRVELSNICQRLLIGAFQAGHISVQRYKYYLRWYPKGFFCFNNFCLYSNRRRGVYRCALGRNALREIYSLGLLTGLRKATW